MSPELRLQPTQYNSKLQNPHTGTPGEMKLTEYISCDGLGIAELIRNREINREEALKCAMDAAELLNPDINAIIELFPEPLAASDDAGAPFHGVPFLIKDLALHA